MDYYRGLIALRMQLPALQDKTADAAQRIVSAVNLASNCVGITLRNDDENTKWDKLLLIYNGENYEQSVPLPAGTWQILIDGTSSFRWEQVDTITSSVLMQPFSDCILGRISK